MSKSLSANCYKGNRERKVCQRYQNLSKEEKDKKQQYGLERLQKSLRK